MSEQLEIRPGETKTEAILRLRKQRNLRRADIAKAVSCTKNYVSMIEWRHRHPGYHAEWMRRKRNPTQQETQDGCF